MTKTRLAPMLLASLLAASPALANGRFPLAQQLLLDPSDENRMWLRATYGILTSSDAGKHWSWICEQAAGYTSGEDPSVVVSADGTFLSGAVEGLSSTTDHGCTWSTVPGLDSRIIVDLTTESDKAHVIALANFIEPDGSYELTGWRSGDSGHTFAAFGAPISADRLGTTIDVAPSDASRIYVTAGPGGRSTNGDAGPARPIDSVLLTSRDGGATWEEQHILGLAPDERPFIAAVHPKNPDVLYLRTRGPQATEGFVDDRLLYSDNGRNAFREVFRASADILGFALADDGNTVLAGLGDSRDPLGLRPVDPSALGVYRATDLNFTFERGLRGQVGCLLDAPAGLFVCGANSQHYELGLSLDEGATASRIFSFGKQVDLLACGAQTTVASVCNDAWPFICPTIGNCNSQQDAGSTNPAAAGDGAGCCSSGARPAPDTTKTGTARLDVLSSSPEPLVAAGVLVALLRRKRRLTARKA